MERRDALKQKAWDARVNHAHDLGVPVTTLEAWGWELWRMMWDIREVQQVGCKSILWDHCAMSPDVDVVLHPLSLQEIHLDISDPAVEPIYCLNTQWICAKCNRSKGNRSLTRWIVNRRLTSEQELLNLASGPDFVQPALPLVVDFS